MTDLGKNVICPACGSQFHKQKNAVALPLKTILHKRFLVGRVLGEPGGFGITYLAWDMLLDTTAAIKEFLPLSAISRHSDNSSVKVNSKKDQEYFKKGLSVFLKEAKALAQFSHPNIVRIRDCFTSNNTAYLVMEYHKGAPLNQVIKNSGGILTEDKALEFILPLLDGLATVHSKKFLHRDIKPQNIYITSKGIPLLLDFGASRAALAETDQTLTVMLSDGFAPFEQYHEKGKQGPWSDIYSVGATLYYMVTGKKPANAIERQHTDGLPPPIALNSNLSESFSLAIMRAMSVDPLARPQTINAFKQILTNSLSILPSNPAVFHATEIVAGPATPKVIQHRPKPTVIHHETKKSEWSLGRIFLYVILAVTLWSSWSTRQILTSNNAVVNTAKPPLQEPNRIANNEFVEYIEVEPQNFAPELSQEIEFTPTYSLTNQVEQPSAPINPVQQPAQPIHQARPPRHEPAISACKYKRTHSPCSFFTPRESINGFCLPDNNNLLACFPNKPPPAHPPRPRQRPKF